jgi:hypothetical protein
MRVKLFGILFGGKYILSSKTGARNRTMIRPATLSGYYLHHE